MLVAGVSQTASDVLFISLASHMTLLLNLVQLKIRDLGMSPDDIHGNVDCYEDIKLAIKTHQKVIR